MDLRLGKNAVFFKNTFYDFCIPILRLLTYCGLMPVCLHRVLKVKAVVAAFNQEKALVVQLRRLIVFRTIYYTIDIMRLGPVSPPSPSGWSPLLMVSCNHHIANGPRVQTQTLRTARTARQLGTGEKQDNWSCLCKSYHLFSTHIAHVSAFHVSIWTLFSSNYFMLPTTLCITKGSWNHLTLLWHVTLRRCVERHWWLIGYQTTACVPRVLTSRGGV